jgi:tRNA modification GTPase
VLENYGIERTYKKIQQAAVILYVFDINQSAAEEIHEAVNELKQLINKSNNGQRIIIIANKIDLLVSAPRNFGEFVDMETIFISAKRKENLKIITESLVNSVKEGILLHDETVVTNLRHYEALSKSLESLDKAEEGIKNKISGDLLSIDINDALYHLGSITGEVTSEEILDTIFMNFCIGK